MSHDTWDYASYLREQGYRITPQRQIIMDAICEADGHTSFPEILARVQTKAPAITQATVYRSLHFLLSTGLIAKAEINSGETVYEMIGPSPHHHLICANCQTEIEIDAEPLEKLQADLRARYDFVINASHMMLTGLCGSCRDEG